MSVSLHTLFTKPLSVAQAAKTEQASTPVFPQPLFSGKPDTFELNFSRPVNKAVLFQGNITLPAGYTSEMWTGGDLKEKLGEKHWEELAETMLKCYPHRLSTLEDARDFLEYNVQGGSDTVYVAVFKEDGEKEKRIAGFAGSYGTYIDWVAVDPEFQGQKLGQYMMEQYQDWAKRENIEALYLDVRSKNPKAWHIYEKVGFVADPGTIANLTPNSPDTFISMEWQNPDFKG